MTDKHYKNEENGRVFLPASPGGGEESLPVSVRRYAMTRKQKNSWLERNTKNTEHLDLQVEKSREKRRLMSTLKRKIRLFSFLVAALAGIVILALVLQYGSALFVVRQITVTGTERYSAASLSAAGGFGEGTLLKNLSCEEAAERIRQNYPGFADCTVESDLSGNVVIRITEYTPVLYFSLGGAFYALTDDLTVTEMTADEDALVQKGLLYADLPEVGKAVVGQKLEFLSGSGTYVTEFLEAARKAGDLEEMKAISFANRYSIVSTQKDGDSVRFGSVENIDRKLQIARRLAEENAAAAGTLRLDVSEPEAALVDTEN